METYEMRSMFTLNMEGLQLRLYQFSSLLHKIVPKLAHYLDSHAIHPAMYASQWFLTLFAYAFPIALIERIYDIIFAEGAAETIMRVAIAMLKRSEDTILYQVNSEFEDVLDFITSKKLCEPYVDNYGHVIRDAMALSDMITRDKMDSLANKYSMMSEEEQLQLQHTPQVVATTNNKIGFWKRRKQQQQQQRSVSSGTKKPDIQRSASAAGGCSTIASMDAANKPPMLKKRWSSVSSSRDWSYNNKTPIIAPGSSSSADTNVATGLLTIELQDLKAVHLKTLAKLDEIENDKQDLECERDALKLTIAELERRRHSSEQHQQQKQRHCDSPIMLPSTSYASNYSTRTSRKNSTSSTVYTEEDENTMTPATSLTFFYPTQQQDKELVHVKVKNFELEQQCEKLNQDLELTQSKFDMVNEGQMALIEKLVSMKVELEELKQENLYLKKTSSIDVSIKQPRTTATTTRRHSTTGVLISNALVADKSSLQEIKSNLVKAADSSIPSASTKKQNKEKKKSSSSSIYGRVLHAFSKPSSSSSTSTITTTAFK